MHTTCTECGVIERHKGHTDSTTGDYILRCQSCGYEWIAMTAEEQEADAKDRMEEAQEVINPVLREFFKSKL